MKTLRNSILSFLSLTLIVASLAGCKKDKDNNDGGSRNVKYELTGNFTGTFTIIITDDASGTQTISNVKMPWSKEVSYNSSVRGIGIGAQTETAGVAGQTGVLRIYSGGNVVKTSNGTASSGGSMAVPSLSHIF